MENTKVTDNRLLAARQEGLKQAESHSLRPLGKLWGMDVFAWYNPSVNELSATLTTFPFPVFWLGNEELIKELSQVDPESMRSLAWCGQYDCAQISIPGDVMGPMRLLTATETLEETITILRSVKQAKHILLFTVAGNEWKTKLADFEAFVRLNGTK